MRTRSLRTRLVATMLLLLALASAVVAVVTTLALRQFLVGRLDGELRAVGAIAQRVPFPFPGGPAPYGPGGPGTSDGPAGPGGPDGRDGRGPGPPDTLIARLDGGRVIGAVINSREGETVAVPAAEYPALLALPADGRPYSVDLGELGSYRLLATGAPNGQTVVTGLSERAQQETLARLQTIELVVTLVTLLGAGMVGAFVVRRELAPLERVAATAARVSTLPLDRGEVSLAERVPDADPGSEVGQVGAALNRMLDHVGAALEARQDSETRLRQFVADASHELRTPLAAIRGYAELGRRGETSPDAEYSLDRIASQTRRMTTLVEDLLLLARLDAGRPLERVEVDLTRLVVDAVSDAHVSGPDHRWQLDLPDEPVTVPGDPARLAQVLANLLANARTHTPAGTSVSIGLRGPGRVGREGEGEGAELSVVDAGPGIPPDLLPHVFERFARGSSSRSRQHGSTGLGLAIVHAVVAAHGGTVTVCSEPGRTGFTVRLPDVAPPVAPAPAEPGPAISP